MNPNHLKTFLAVRKHLSYTRAAEQVLRSQPAVSRQIHQLEAELGIPLFEQIGKSLHLTDAGRTLAGEAEKVLGTLERAAETVRRHRSAEHGSLRIGASTTPGFYLLPALLGRFHRRFPEVELQYAVENSLRIEQRLVRNELDLGFVGIELPNDDLHVEPIVQDEIVCFASPKHPLARRRRIDPRSLEGETCVMRERGSATRELFEAWLARAGGKIGRTIELESPEAAKLLVAAGVGFSFMSLHGLQSEIRRRRFKKLPVTGLKLERPIYLVRHADKRTSPVTDAFLSIVRTTLGTDPA
ncbi:MAG: LysR family transcriptional regulator [Myxococcota bacterium]